MNIIIKLQKLKCRYFLSYFLVQTFVLPSWKQLFRPNSTKSITAYVVDQTSSTLLQLYFGPLRSPLCFSLWLDISVLWESFFPLRVFREGLQGRELLPRNTYNDLLVLNENSYEVITCSHE